MLTECADLIGDRPIVLSGPDTGADVQVSADGDALKRILIQLVANGVKFTETGAVSLDVQYEDDALVFTVALIPAPFPRLSKLNIVCFMF